MYFLTVSLSDRASHASSLVAAHLPVLGAYPLYLMDKRLSCTASITSTGGFKLPKTVGSPENIRNLGLWFQQERLADLRGSEFGDTSLLQPICWNPTFCPNKCWTKSRLVCNLNALSFLTVDFYDVTCCRRGVCILEEPAIASFRT